MISITCTNESAAEMHAVSQILQELVQMNLVAAPVDGASGGALQTPQDVVHAAVAAVAGKEPSATEVFGGNVAPPPPVAPLANAPIASHVGASTNAQTAASVSPPPPPALPLSTAPLPTTLSGDLDRDGFLWDERIHSKGKTKIADGTWKLKKGADKALVEQIRSQLRASGHAPVAASLAAVGVPPPPPPVTGATPANPSDPHDPASLMMWVMNLSQAQKLTHEQIHGFIGKHTPGMHVITEHPAAVPAIVADIKAFLGL